MRSLAAVCGYVQWRRAPHEPPPDLAGVDVTAARALVAAELARRPEGGPLTAGAAAALLACYGIGVWPTRLVADVEAAVGAARELGFPVVLKASDPALAHRTDLGGGPARPHRRSRAAPGVRGDVGRRSAPP